MISSVSTVSICPTSHDPFPCATKPQCRPLYRSAHIRTLHFTIHWLVNGNEPKFSDAGAQRSRNSPIVLPLRLPHYHHSSSDKGLKLGVNFSQRHGYDFRPCQFRRDGGIVESVARCGARQRKRCEGIIFPVLCHLSQPAASICDARHVRISSVLRKGACDVEPVT